MNPHFAPLIEDWYAQHGRELPWRQTHDAYHIWVSEIILQQTRVEQGRAYYERFIHRFPDVRALANASEDEVLSQWQGLGYYTRARNMHAAAKQIVEMGRFPQTYNEILRLKGVGEYTAAAIASFAFNEARAVLDGNVFRVLSRYFNEATPIDSTAGRKLFVALAAEMLDTSRPALYNQAIMDFGALQCRQQSPLCATCVLAESCAAFAAGTQHNRPVKAHRTRVSDRFLTYICVCDPQGRLLVQRRNDNDIWRGLYQFPLLESNHQLTIDEIVAQLPKAVPVPTLIQQGYLHQLSHQRLHVDFYRLSLSPDYALAFPGQWVTPSQLDQFALPRLLTRFLDEHIAKCLHQS